MDRDIYSKFKIIEFDEGKKYTSKKGDEVILVDDFDSVDDCGFKLPDEILVVDIDELDKTTCQELLRIINTKTMYTETTRGLHLYYKKPQGYKSPRGGKGVTPMGFPVEHKQKQITIKLNGELRKIHNEGVFEELPYYFRIHNHLPNLLGLGDGERYSNLIQFNGTLSGKHLKTEIFEFINEYIFSEPMSTEHLRNANYTVKFDKNSEDDITNPSRVAKYFIKEMNPILFEDVVYYKINGVFTADVDVVYRWMNTELPEMSSYLQDEVLKQIRRRCPFHKGYKEWKIRTPNGVLHRGRFTYIEGGYPEFTPYTLPYPYDPDTPATESIDKLLTHISGGDVEYVNYILSMFAASLITSRYKRAKEPRFHIIIGDGGNFKGTSLKVLGLALGEDNVANNKLDALGDEKKVLAMQGKLANIGEDILDRPINEVQMSNLKNITAADTITMRELYQSAKNGVIVMSNLIFSSNHVLKSFEKGESFKRRIKWVPMFKGVPESEFDDDFFDELYSDESIKYMTKLIIEAYFDLYANGFPKCKIIDTFTESYHDENNNVAQYLKEIPITEFLNNKPKACYDEYASWAEEEGLNPSSKKQFDKALTDKYKLVVKVVCNKETGGKSRRVYAARED